MGEQTVLDDSEYFDEIAYLRLYPDVMQAVSEGREATGWQHYDRHGRKEGRKPNDFDADYYLRAYPSAAQEIATGSAATPFEHWCRFGRARGFLSNARAQRPHNPAAMPSRFGGLWPDLANAADAIQGRLEIGQITEREAERLTFWTNNGYVLLDQAIPPALADRASLDLDRGYSGGYADLRFRCSELSPDVIPWCPEINPHPAKALDIHHFSPAIRDVMFAEAVVAFLGLLFEAKTFASQTLGYLRGSAQESHQDTAYVAYTVPRQFAASWVALEDVTIGAGELFYYPASHRFDDYAYNDGFKSIHEARRVTGQWPPREQMDGHALWLDQQAARRGIPKTVFAARKGDVLIWHADLAHGGNPVSRTITRKSIVTHYCPKHLAPLFCEQTPTRVWEHGGHRYTSGYYTSEPLR